MNRVTQLFVALLAVAPLGLVLADDATPRVVITSTDTLPRNAHANISVLVELPPGSESQPLTLTPHIEGAAVELMRGRFLRADAKREDERHLRFVIPVVARSEGTAILRVALMTYRCDPGCRRVDAGDTRVLRVR